MIFHPRVGQTVRMHYSKQARGAMPLHGRVGVVKIVARGRGPRNVGVEVDGRVVVIPRGNLVIQEKTPASSRG